MLHDIRAQGRKLADGSFRLSLSRTTAGGACGKRKRALIEVASNGSLRELPLELVDDSPSCP